MKVLECKKCGDIQDYETSLIDCVKPECKGIYTVEHTEEESNRSNKQIEEERVEDFKTLFGEDVYYNAFVCPNCDIENGIGHYKFKTNTIKNKTCLEVNTEFCCDECEVVITKRFLDGEQVDSKISTKSSLRAEEDE